MQKSPLQCIMCRLSSCVLSVNMAIQKSRSVKLFSALVDMLFNAQHMKCWDGDLAKAEYKCFLSKEVALDREKFSNFDFSKKWVDTFLCSYLNKIDAYKQAWMVLIFVFTLSHGQSQVERCVNINDDIMVENMHNDSLIVQRIVYDQLKCSNFQPHNHGIGQKLRASVLSAYLKYKLVRSSN